MRAEQVLNNKDSKSYEMNVKLYWVVLRYCCREQKFLKLK